MANVNGKRVTREAHLRWVPIPEMKISPLAQREIKKSRVDYLAANFDLEQLGTPTVNERDGHFWIIDGGHRIETLKVIGWGDQQVQCFTYHGLTDEEEAEKFLQHNDTLTVNVFTKFRVGVKAGRAEESDIDRIVRAQGLCVSMDKVPGAIKAVGTLRRIYKRADPNTLARTLILVRDAYGDAGFQAAVLDGLGLVCQRYNGELETPAAIDRLSKTHGGVHGLLGEAEKLRRATGNAKSHCVAAAAVDIINRGQRHKKLQSWWV